MAGAAVGIVGAGGVGVATASALIMRGLAGRVTIYSRERRRRARPGPRLHARPAAARRGSRSAASASTRSTARTSSSSPPATTRCRVETRLDILHENIEVMDSVATAVEAGELPRIAIVVTNPLDVLTEYLTRRWDDRPVAGHGFGHRARDAAAHRRRSPGSAACTPGACTRGWSASTATRACSCSSRRSSARCRSSEFAAPARRRPHARALGEIERDVRSAAYQVRDLKGSAVQGIGLTVSGLVARAGPRGRRAHPGVGPGRRRHLREPAVRPRPRRPERAALAADDRRRAGGVGALARGAQRRRTRRLPI